MLVRCAVAMRWSCNHRIGIVYKAVAASLALKRPDKPGSLPATNTNHADIAQ